MICIVGIFCGRLVLLVWMMNMNCSVEIGDFGWGFVDVRLKCRIKILFVVSDDVR